MSNLIHTIAVVVQVLSALGVILLVLIQHGKGADMGAAFGSGASGSLFGATGSANFLSRLTAVLAATFFISTLGLAFLANDRPRAPGSLMEGAVPTAPASPASSIPAGTPMPPAAPKDVPTVGGSGASSSSVPSSVPSTVPSTVPSSAPSSVPSVAPAIRPPGGESSSSTARPSEKGAAPASPGSSDANSSSSVPAAQQEGANSK